MKVYLFLCTIIVIIGGIYLQCVKITGAKKLKVEEMEMPERSRSDVIIKVNSCGICGSDIHVYHGKHPFTSYPVTLGHEVSGEVVKLGKDVTVFHEGQKVTIEPQVYCGECYPCRHGKY